MLGDILLAIVFVSLQIILLLLLALLCVGDVYLLAISVDVVSGFVGGSV